MGGGRRRDAFEPGIQTGRGGLPVRGACVGAILGGGRLAGNRWMGAVRTQHLSFGCFIGAPEKYV